MRQSPAEDVKIERAELNRLLSFTVQLAREAGEITLKYFRSALTPERKADGSFVTRADREAEAFIRARLAESFPDDAVLGEVEGTREGTSGRQWIVDPLDGTDSFVHVVPLFGVLSVLEISDKPAVC